MSKHDDAVKAKSIFLNAIEGCAPEEWSTFLDRECGGNAELRRHVERLLAGHRKDVDLVERGEAAINYAMPTLVESAVQEEPGSVIGRYKLLEQIGEGGFGVVFMAEQEEPVRRKVALKVIKPGMDTKEVIARFEAERQALALMDHPNIAKVLDAGTTEPPLSPDGRGAGGEGGGRPYFVMELVRGVPITEYCDQNNLPARDRLQLFHSVCQAVQHAHQKGIIHRDIKPSNVLVTLHDDKPVPKVIDFGVAKATNARLTEKTLFTRFAQMVGTPLYMSPEQAQMSGLDVDTRSDIYSLGVLLYELLTGTTPFDQKRIREAAYDELLRIIREEEPPRPSTRVSTLGESATISSAQRDTDPKRLSQSLRGELDWIVMKALEKDRTRRYETANAFAADVQHYLNDEAVMACPPSAGYRFSKFVRRNRTAMATTAAVALSLIVGTALATWQAFRATQERNRTVIAEELAADEANRARDAEQRAVAEAEKALTEAAISEAVVEFLNRDLLDQADPRNEPDRDVSLRAVVDRAVERIEGRFEEQPLVEARIRVTLAGCLHSLGEYQKAEEQFRQAHQLYKAELGPDHRSTLVSEGNIAVALTGLRNYSEAESIIRDVLEREREVLGTDDHNTLWSMSLLALLLGFQGGDHEDWEETARDVLRMREARYSADHPQVLWSRYEVARAISYGRSDAARREAEELLWEILRVQQRVLSADHPDCMRTQEQLASSIQGQRRFVESEAIHRDVVERRRRVLGWGHPQTLFSTNGLGRALWRQHRYEEAATLLNEALEHFDLSNEDANSWIHENLSLQSIVAGELSDHVRAVELARLASEVRTDLYGLDDERTREANHELLDRCLKGAWHYATATDPDNRLPVQSLEMARTAVALDPQNAEAMSILGVAQVRNGDWGEAVSILEKSRSMHDEGDPEHRFFLAMALWKAGRADDALVAFDEALSWLYGSQRREEQYRFRAEAESVIGLNEIHDFVQSADETASVSHLQKLAHVQAQLRLNDVVGEGYARVVELAESQGRDATLIWRDLYPLGQIFEHIAEQSTQRPQLWEQRGDYYAVRGYWQEAAACYRQSAGIIQLGCCLLLSGDEDGYRTLCARQLKRFDANAESIDPHELAQLCSIAPQAGVDREQIVDSARNAVSTVRDKYTLHVLGCALLRAGEYAEAIVPFLEANEGRQGAGQMNAFPLAIAYQHLGDEIQSRHWFVFGIRQMALALEDDPERAAWGPRNWLNANVWRREAEALLQWPTPRPLESTPDIKSSPLVSLPAAGGDETAGRADED